NSTDDRQALQKEVNQLMSEIDRVADTTNFNNTKLLDGSFTTQPFQVGANQGETIDIAAITDANIAALGTCQSVETTGMAAGANAEAQGTNIAAAINAITAQTGVTASAATSGAVTLTSTGDAAIVIAGTAANTNTGFTAGSTPAAETTVAAASQIGFAGLDI